MKNKQGPTLFTRIIALFAVTLVPLATTPVSLAATLYWDPDATSAGNIITPGPTAGTGLGGSGTWDLSSPNWWDGISADVPWSNAGGNTAIFWGQTGSSSDISLGTTISAGALVFNSVGPANFILDNGGNPSNTLTLVASPLGMSPTITVGAASGQGVSGPVGAGSFGAPGSYGAYGPGVRVEIDAQIHGTAGLSVFGGGTLVLGNAANDYTGFTGIYNGNVDISDSHALGSSATTVNVGGIAGFGLAGGTLTLAGGTTPFTFSRDLAIAGRGMNQATGAALISVGGNLITGNILFASNTETRVVTVGQNTVFGSVGSPGTMTLAGGSGHVFYGDGNVIINDYITNGAIGSTGIIKTGSSITSTMVLTNVNNDFISNTRIDSGTLRASDARVFGTTTSLNQISFNGGTLELRVDPGQIAGFQNVNVSLASNNGVFFIDRALGGTGLNQTIQFENFTGNVNRTVTFGGSDGYNLTLGNTVGVINVAGAGVQTFTNNSNGLFTINGSVGIGDATSRVFTLNGNADGLFNGSITSGGTADHNLVKSSIGTWTMTGTNSTFTGGTFVTGGTLAVRSIGGVSGGGLNGGFGGVVALGTGGTTTAFDYLGAAVTGAGETTPKAFSMAGTTGSMILKADQAGTAPSGLVLSSSIGNTGGGAKTLFLGGNSAPGVINEIQGVITDNLVTTGFAFTTSLTKVGASTWLYDPTTANYTGTPATPTSAQNTTASTAVGANVITVTSTGGLAVGQVVNGTNIPAGAFITSITSGTQFTISTNIATLVASGTALGFTALAAEAPAALTTTAISAANSNVLTVASTAGLIVGQTVTGSVNVSGTITPLPLNAVITAILSPTTFTISTNIATAVPVGATLAFGTFSNFTGNLLISQGTLQIKPTAASGDGSNVINNTSTLTFNVDPLTGNQTAGGTFEYQGFATGSTENLGPLVVAAGGNTVKITPGATGTSSLVFSSLGAVSTGATVNFVVPVGGSVALTGASGLVNSHLFYNGADFAFAGAGGVLRAPVYDTDANFVSSPTALTATQNNLITGSFATNTISIFTLKMGGQTLTVNAGQTLTITGPNGGGAILETGGSGSITGGAGLSSSGNELVIRVDGATDTLSIDTPLTSSVNNLTKTGAGLLTLSGSNANVGTVTVDEGTLRLSGAGTALGSTNSNLTLRQGATLDLGGSGALGVVQAQTFNGSGLVTNSNSATLSTLMVSAGLFSGTINDGAGKVGLSKVGSGNLVLTGVNNFSGPLSIDGGGIVAVTSLADIGVASGIGAGDAGNNAGSLVFTGAGGTLKYTGSDTSLGSIYQTTQTPSVSTNRLFSIDVGGSGGAATLDSSGTYGNPVLGGGTANNAALVFSNKGDITYVGLGQGNPISLTLQGTSLGDNALNMHLIDNAADPFASGFLYVTKGVNAASTANTGLWVLDRDGPGDTANTYSGDTTIYSGILRATDGKGLSSNSNLVLSGNLTSATTVGVNGTGGGIGTGVLESSGVFTRNLGGGPGEVKWGGQGIGGFAASSAPLTVAIGGVGTETQLTWGGQNSPNTILILNSATALSDVNFTNPIDLDGKLAVIQVDDNSSTNTDYATMSGVLSDTGPTDPFVLAKATLAKTGNGTLYITGNNTYTGNTFINTGNVVVTSVGSSTSLFSSFGTADIDGSFGTTSGVLNIGNGGNAIQLIYIGAGEVSDRQINLSGTTGQITLDSDGSGALVLTKVSNTGAGAKLLVLRGYNTDNNEISSPLVNTGGNLSVQKTDGGTWILSGDNTFTGGLAVNSGFLGITSTHAAGSSSLGAPTNIVTTSNAAIFAVDAPTTIANPIVITNNTTLAFTGNYSITIAGGTFTGQSGNPWTINNTLANGATLTINSNFINADTNNNTVNRTFTFAGTGNTTYNGVIQNSTSGATTQLNITTSGTYTVGNGANTYSLTTIAGTVITGGTSISQGNLVIAAAGSAVTTSGPLGAATAQFQFNGGTLSTTVVGGLVGTTKLQNPVILNGNPAVVQGSNSIEFGGAVTNFNGSRFLFNNLTGGAALTLSNTVNLTNDATARTLFVAGTGNTTISGAIVNGGTATGSALQMEGTGTLTLTGTNTFTGALTVQSGNVVLTGANGSSTSTFTVNSSGTLTLDNALANPTVANRTTGKAVTLQGGTLSFISLNAGASAEVAGILTLNSLSSNITMTGTGTGTLTFASLAFGTAGMLTVNAAGLGTTNKILFTTAPVLTPATTGILARAIVNGTDFATYNGTSGLIAFTGYTATTNIDAASTTATLDVTGNASSNGVKTINALRINGSGITVSGPAPLTITSGGLLNIVGSNTLSVLQTNFGGTTAALSVGTGASLNVTGSMVGTGGYIKGLTGTLTLSAKQFVAGTSAFADGTTVLGGGLNTLWINQQINMGTTATLDLHGTTQYIGTLATTATQADSGGTVTSNTANGMLIVNENASSTYGGHLNDGTGGGKLTFVRTQGNTLTLESASNFSGAAILMGGTTILQDSATWLNVASIDVNYATFQIGNNTGLQIDMGDRVNDLATITMRGGQLNWTGRALDASSEKFGTLNIAEGASGVLIQSGNSGTYFSGDATFASLTRTANSGSTVNFTTNNTFGADDNNVRVFFTTAPTMQANGSIGAWAIANTQDYATYSTTNGLGAFGAVGFKQYDTTLATGNVTNLLSTNTNLATNLTAPSTSTGLLRLAGIFNSDVTFGAAGNVLNIEQGGILHANTSGWSTFGTTSTRGVLTAGGTATTGNTELIVYNNNGTANNLTGSTLSTTIQNATVAGSNILSVTSVGSIAVGNIVVLAGVLPIGTVVTAVDPINLLVTLSQPALTTTNAGTFAFTQNTTTNLTGAAANATVLGSTTLSLTGVGQAAVVGMIVTGPNIPVGTTVVAVDTVLNTVTLSQAATLTATGGTFAFLATSGVNGSVVINSVVEDTHTANGSGSATVSLVKSGAGIMILTAPNTYTGGTIVDQGSLYLEGGPGTVVIPFSPNGLVINGGTPGATVLVQELFNAGQIDPANTVTINGGGTLTLVGNNTLAGLAFNNDGNNATPTVNTVGTLTLGAAGIKATSQNVGTTATINGTLQLASGANTMNIEAIKVLGQVVSTVQPSLNIAAAIIGTGSILKTNDGILQLSSAASTFSGGVHVTTGGLLFSNNSTPANPGDGAIVSGPLGTGTLALDGGTALLVDASRTVANNVTFAGNTTFDTTAGSAVTMTLNGTLTLPTGAFNVSIPNPNMTASLAGPISNAGSVTSINKTGLGTLNINLAGFTGSISAGSGPIGLLYDGDGTGNREVLNIGSVTFDPGIYPIITVGKAASTVPFTNALNKLIAPSSVNSIAGGLQVTNNNGYGLQVPDNVTLNPSVLINVINATNSNGVQGLYLTGKLSGSGVTLTKAGAGTAVLDNITNDFTGSINITGGILSVAANEDLGNLSNPVTLSIAGTSAVGFRATGSFATSRIFNLTQATNAFEVTQGVFDAEPATYSSLVNTLTINSALNFTAAANGLVKNDAGTLVLTTVPTVTGGGTWTGATSINQGALRVTANGVLGTGTVTVNGRGADLELAGVTIANAISLTPILNDVITGINSGGMIRAVSGTNVVSTVVSVPTLTFINSQTVNMGYAGVASGATLTLSQGISFIYDLTGGFTGTSFNAYLYTDAGGTLNLNGAISQAASASQGVITTLRFNGYGTWNLTAANTFTGRNDSAITSGGTQQVAILVNGGTVNMTGAASFTNSANGALGTIDVNAGGTLALSALTTGNTTALGGRNVRLFGGTLSFTTSVGGITNLLLGNSNATSLNSSFTFGQGLDSIVLNGSTAMNLTFQQTTTSGNNVGIIRSTGGVGVFKGTGITNGVATIVGGGAATGGFTFRGQTGATGTLNKSIVPWAFIDNGTTVNFVTADAAAAATLTGTSALRTLAAGEQTSTLTTNDNIDLSSTPTISGSFSINSLKLEANAGVTVTGLQGFAQATSLTIQSGGLIAMGSNTITAPLVIATTGDLVAYDVTDLTINGAILAPTGLTKVGAGTLTVNGPSFTGQTTVTQGTLVLGGGNNTLFTGNGTAAPGQNAYIGQNGTLDLNGNNQLFATILTPGSDVIKDVGGVIKNSSATQAILSLGVGNNWGGSIQGAIAVDRSQTNNGFSDWTVHSAQIFTGPLVLTGGRINLAENGTFSNIASFDIDYASILINSQGASFNDLVDDRINDAAQITLRGGMLQYRGRNNMQSTETLGAVVLAEATNLIDIGSGGNSPGTDSTVVTIASLTRVANSHATLRVQTVTGAITGDEALLRITAAPALTNNIIGGWAISTREFATYAPDVGVGALSAGGFATYSINTINTPLPQDNIKVAYSSVVAATTTLTADRTMYTLNFGIASGTASSVNTLDLGGHTLDLVSGGLILGVNNDNNNITIQNGLITVGTAGVGGDFYLHAASYGGVNRTVTISAGITNNAGGAVALVLDGDYGTAGQPINSVTLTGANDYSGGTFVNSGILLLNVAGANGTTTTAIPGDLTIYGGFSVNTNANQQATGGLVRLLSSNQIKNTANVTVGGSALLDLNGFNQTLNNLTVNVNGGSLNTFVTLGAGTLTLNGGLTVTDISAGLIPSMTATGVGNLFLPTGQHTFNIDAIRFQSTGTTAANIAANGQIIAPVSPSFNISAPITGDGSILKSGAGILELSGLNTFTGGVHVTGGGLLLAGNNSNPTAGGQAILNGPLGTGSLVMDGGTTLLVDASRTIANNITFGGDPIFDTNANGAVTLTLNGTITFTPTAGVVNISIANPEMTVAIQGTVANAPGSITTVNKTGLGILILSGFNGNINGGSGPLSLLFDGNGTGDRQTVAFGDITFSPGATPDITIGRAASTQPYTLAVNKIAAPTSFTPLNNGIIVRNNQGYGLQIPNGTTFTGPATINVVTQTNSNVIQGLYINGDLHGTVTTLTKSGAGTVVLGGLGNDFVGTIDITAGIVSVDNNAELGDPSNVVKLDNNAATLNGLRATGTFATSHTINLAQALNSIEVTSSIPMGTPPGLTLGAAPVPSTPFTLTVNSPFTFGAATNALQKNDNGILELKAANPTWTGILTIAAGAVEVSDPGALGTTAGNTVVSNTVGAALQLNNVSINEPLSLSSTGINNNGALEGLAGTSTESGAITLTNSATIGADAGGTLNLTGTINGAAANTQTLTFSGAGNTVVNLSASIGATTTVSTITKIGTGTTTVLNANAAFVAALNINNGTVDFTGAGTTGGTGTITVNAGGVLTLDNSTTGSNINVNNRLATRPLAFNSGGVLNFIGDNFATATNTSETLGALTLNTRGETVFNITQGSAAQQTALTFASVNRAAVGTTMLINLLNGATLATAAANGKSTLVFTSTSGFSQDALSTNTNGTVTKAVIPWAVVFDAATGIYSYATVDATATTFIRAITSTEMTAANATTVNANVLISSGTALANSTIVNLGNIAFNSLTLGGVGTSATMTINGLTQVQLGSGTAGGAILAWGNGNDLITGAGATATAGSVTGPGLLTAQNSSASNNDFIIHVEGTTTLTIDSFIGNSSGGITKDGTGTLVLNNVTSTLSTNNLNGGTLQLGTAVGGATNLLRYDANLAFDGGATLDLHGNNQFVAILLNDNAVADSTGASVAGRIVNTASATKQSTFVSNNDNNARNWSGVIGGGAGLNNIAWQRTGFNTLAVFSNNDYTGRTALLGGLTQLRDEGQLSKTSAITIGYATLQIDNNGTLNLPDRVNDSAPITMAGGTIIFVGRPQMASSEVLGGLTLAEGANTVQVNSGNAGTIVSADLYFTSLDSRAPGATLDVVQGTNSLGLIGSNVRVHFLTAPALNSSGVLGSWAVAGNNDFAAYDIDMGVGAVGQQGFRAYDTTFVSGNITSVGAVLTNLTAPVTTTGMLRLAPSVTGNIDVTFSAGGNVLQLEQGGLLRGNNTSGTSIGTAAVRGVITAGTIASTGTTELDVFNYNSGTVTANGASTTAGGPATTVGSTTLNLASVANLFVGMTVVGPNIPVNTTIVSVGTTSVVLSNPALATTSTNTTVAGTFNNSGSYVFTPNFNINSVIADTSTAIGGAGIVSLVKAGTGVLALTANNTYTGGTTVNQGTLNLLGSGVVIPNAADPTKGLVINGGSTNAFALVNVYGAGQIGALNDVTINGSGILNLAGTGVPTAPTNNTFNALFFNNDGGNPATLPSSIYEVANQNNGLLNSGPANGYMMGGFLFANGALSITSGNITATSSNAGSVSTIAGRVDFGATPVTITTTPVTFNGESIAPFLATFALQGIYGSTGGITIAGSGTVQLNAQETYTGPTTVTGTSTLQIGVLAAGSRFSDLTLNSGTFLNLAGAGSTWGSLSGSGTVYSTGVNVGATLLNSLNAPNIALTVGFDNNPSTIFSGQFNRYTDAWAGSVSLTKVGTGNMNLTGAAAISLNADGIPSGPANAAYGTVASTGVLIVEQGIVTYSGAGTGGFSVNQVESGGSLILDNTTTNVTGNGIGANSGGRLNFSSTGATNPTGTLNVLGGTFSLIGNALAATNEPVNVLTIGPGTGNIILTPQGGQNLTLEVNTLTGLTAGGTAVLRNLGVGSTAKLVVVGTGSAANLPGSQGNGASGSPTMSIRPDLIGDNIATGFDSNLAFVGRDPTSGVFHVLSTSANEMTTTITGAGIANTNFTLSANDLYTATSQSANSLRLETGINITGALPNTTAGTIFNVSAALLNLNVTTGGILTLTGDSTITTGQLTTTDNNLYLYTSGTSTLTVNAFIGAITNLTKSLDGTVTLNKFAFDSGTNTVNGGKLVLGAGDNTLLVNATGTSPTLPTLALNGTGVLDLNGHNQAVGVLTSNNPLAGAGGTVTNSNATRVTFRVTDNASFQDFGGVIDGNLNFYRYGNNNMTLSSVETYQGDTIFAGATTYLRDAGTLAQTQSVTVNYANLVWDNEGLNPSATSLPTRIDPSVPVTLRGGTFTVIGAGTLDTNITFNSLAIQDGQNSITLAPQINSGSNVVVNIGNLTHTSNESTLSVSGFVGQTTTNNSAVGNGNFQVNTLGQSNLINSSQVFISQLNGSAFSSATLVNNLIGGWAVANGDSFATYSDIYGLASLGQSAAYANYDASVITAGQPIFNVNQGAAETIAANVQINSLRLSGLTDTVNNGITLKINVGIVTNNGGTSAISAASGATTANLTTNGGDLYVYGNQGTTSISTNIVDPSVGANINLVKSGGGALTLAPLAGGGNTFGGGIYVQAGTLNIAAPASNTIVVPHDLILNNANATFTTLSTGQIAATSNVTINGAGSFTLANYTAITTTTLASFNFNGVGGSSTPTVNLQTPTALSTLILTSNNAINSVNDNFGFTPTMTATAANLTNGTTALEFTGTAPVITTSGASPDDLLIALLIITDPNSAGPITKAGTGSLILSNTNTFTNGFDLQGGTLIAANNQAVGTGALTIEDGTAVQSDGTVRTLNNTVTVNGNFTVSGSLSGNGITFSNTVNLGTAPRTIAVTNPLVTATISGQLTSGAGSGLTKNGAGVLLLSNAANNYTGATTVNGGVLRIGAINGLPTGTALSIASGAAFDMNNFDQTTGSLAGAGLLTNAGGAIHTFTTGGDNSNTTFSGIITAATAANLNLIKTGTGTLTLSGPNSYAGKTSIQNGALSVSTINKVTGGAASSSLGAPTTVANGTIDFGNSSGATGTLIVTGAGGETTDRVVNFAGANGGATIENDATAPVVFTSNSTGTGTGTNLFTLQGSNTGANAFNGNIVNTTTGATSVAKTGTGNWAINGTANNYTGTTTVNQGILQVGTAGAGTTGTGLVTASGTGSLSGTGTVVGAATFNTGSTLAPGDNFGTGVGNIRFSNGLTMTSGSTVAMGFNSPTLNDPTIITDSTASFATYQAYVNSQASTWDAATVPAGSHDSITVTGNISLAAGGAYVLNGPSPLLGDVIDLMDWNGSLATNGFNAGGDANGLRNGGTIGDLTLPILGQGIYDVSHFTTNGFIVVLVPEPSRALLMMLGVAMLFMRRRRRA